MSLKKITREGYAFFLIISKRIYAQYDTPPNGKICLKFN